MLSPNALKSKVTDGLEGLSVRQHLSKKIQRVIGNIGLDT